MFAPAFSQDGEGHLDRFFREARILFKLAHPYITRIYNVGIFVEHELISQITKAGEGVVGGHYTAPELVADPLLLGSTV